MIDIPLTIARPRTSASSDVETRNISGLAEITGSGTGTIRTATGYVIPTGIGGAGMYGVPGVAIYSESGGSLSATARLYDESGNDQGSISVKTITGAGSTVASGSQTMSCSKTGAGTVTSSWYSFGVSGDASKSYYLAWTATVSYGGGSLVDYSVDSIEIESGTTVSPILDYFDEDTYSGLVQLDTTITQDYTRFSGPITVPTGALIRARFTVTMTNPNAAWSSSCTLRLLTLT
jgi:hypothetical protein